MENELEKTFNSLGMCSCISSSPGGLFKLIGRLATGAYIPGDVICLDFKANNNTNINIRSFKIKFKQIVTFKPYYKKYNMSRWKKQDEKVLGKQSTGGCLAMTNSHYILRFHVPPTLPSELRTNFLFKLEYILEVIFQFYSLD